MRIKLVGFTLCFVFSLICFAPMAAAEEMNPIDKYWRTNFQNAYLVSQEPHVSATLKGIVVNENLEDPYINFDYDLNVKNKFELASQNYLPWQVGDSSLSISTKGRLIKGSHFLLSVGGMVDSFEERYGLAAYSTIQITPSLLLNNNCIIDVEGGYYREPSFYTEHGVEFNINKYLSFKANALLDLDYGEVNTYDLMSKISLVPERLVYLGDLRYTPNNEWVLYTLINMIYLSPIRSLNIDANAKIMVNYWGETLPPAYEVNIKQDFGPLTLKAGYLLTEVGDQKETLEARLKFSNSFGIIGTFERHIIDNDLLSLIRGGFTFEL